MSNQNSWYGQWVLAATTGKTAGKTFIVADSTNSNINFINDFYNPDSDGTARRLSTITAAIAACTADNGDVIYVAPGHTETVIGAAGLAVNVAGISIIGLGNGTLRPTINFTTAITASMDVTAANVTFQNMIFTVWFDAITAMINVSTAGVSFLDCQFNTNNATMWVVLWILTAATASELVVKGCRFQWPAVNSGTTTTAQIKHEVWVDYVIEDNYFTGKMTQSILNATALLRGSIHNNRFVVATGTKAIAVHASSTPFISNNRINVPSGTAPIVAAAGFVAGNVYSAAVGVTAGTASTI